MLIKDILKKYSNLNYNILNAENLAAEEIVLLKIASSPLADVITLKGGIVMFNLTNNSRRVTQDIDFDLIRYSISNDSIKKFVNKLNTTKDGIKASIIGDIKQLHQEDYQGVRVHLQLEDKEGYKLRIKLDIGVHTYSAIEQNKILFSFNNDGESVEIKVNPTEQIFAEKLLSLARLGVLTTRYKDLYDLYYLVNNCLIDIYKVRYILNLFFQSTHRGPKNIDDLVNAIESTLENKTFSNEASKPSAKWIAVEYEDVKKTILDFVFKL